METDIDALWDKLRRISEDIDRDVFRGTKQQCESGWGGSGVIFTKDLPGTRREASIYPDIRYVVTPFADDAAGLLKTLGDLFSGAGLIDSLSKFAFFGRLATAAVRYQRKTRNEMAQGLLNAMLWEAERMLFEMEKGSFRDRTAERRNAVAEDLQL